VITSSHRGATIEATRLSVMRLTEPDLVLMITGHTVRGYELLKFGSGHFPILRGNEIKAYVDWNFRFVKKRGFCLEEGKDFTYVIIDDNDDMLLEQKDVFVQTDRKKGLTSEDADRAIQILKPWEKDRSQRQ
jgi:hypothetical protein